MSGSELLSGLLDAAKETAAGVAEGAQDAATASKIPLRGILWDIDLMDTQGFTLLPLGRYLLAAGAAYGAFKLIGGR